MPVSGLSGLSKWGSLESIGSGAGFARWDNTLPAGSVAARDELVRGGDTSSHLRTVAMATKPGEGVLGPESSFSEAVQQVRQLWPLRQLMTC